MKSLEQIRAKYAFEIASQVGQNKEFLSLARNIPSMLQTNGLLATWAFLLAKDKPEHRRIRQSLFAHFTSDGCNLSVPDNLNDTSIFTDYWTNNNSGDRGLILREFTQEAIAFSVWLKRAAEALCDTGGN